MGFAVVSEPMVALLISCCCKNRATDQVQSGLTEPQQSSKDGSETSEFCWCQWSRVLGSTSCGDRKRFELLTKPVLFHHPSVLCLLVVNTTMSEWHLVSCSSTKGCVKRSAPFGEPWRCACHAIVIYVACAQGNDLSWLTRPEEEAVVKDGLESVAIVSEVMCKRQLPNQGCII